MFIFVTSFALWAGKLVILRRLLLLVLRITWTMNKKRIHNWKSLERLQVYWGQNDDTTSNGNVVIIITVHYLHHHHNSSNINSLSSSCSKSASASSSSPILGTHHHQSPSSPSCNNMANTISLSAHHHCYHHMIYTIIGPLRISSSWRHLSCSSPPLFCLSFLSDPPVNQSVQSELF